MGINRDSRHKKRLTGGRMPIHKKKRAFEKARPVSNTKLDLSTGKVDKRVRHVRVRGGNYKFRALRLKEGNFNWASESVTKKARIINVVYNASNNELVRTNTLVKNCIVIIDATPFKAWYSNHYGVEVGPSIVLLIQPNKEKEQRNKQLLKLNQKLKLKKDQNIFLQLLLVDKKREKLIQRSNNNLVNKDF
jgi:small subunit ribosomal protein S8e